MKDKRIKFFQIAAKHLMGRGKPFTFNGESYLNAPSTFDLSFDANDPTKVWIETHERWTWFIDTVEFKDWLNKNFE